LKDGSRYTIAPEERLEAFHAMMGEGSHPLLDLLPQLDLEASPQLREMLEFFAAFRGDSEE